MGNIRVMDDQLANTIAAGEVVERPASVVKELVENAIDAGSDKIDVNIEEGGLSLIRVTDNGCGMDAEDCKLAFERHATSKIKRPRDLFRIRTLGFRGEALPSIASVSKMTLTSNVSSDSLGCRVVLKGGKLEATEEIAAPKGTDVVVRDLFFNTPARLKYMKTIHTEVGHISDYMNRLAFCYPEVAFRLFHNGKPLLKTPGDGKTLHVIAAVYGSKMAKQMIEVGGETVDFRLSGWIARPEQTRSNRSYISTLINGRYVRSYPLSQAVVQGYHTLLPINRFPIVVLHIEMDPTLVDVNVHPAKLEVRLSKQQELTEWIEAKIREALLQEQLIPEPTRHAKKKPFVTEQGKMRFQFPEKEERADPAPSVREERADHRFSSSPPSVEPEVKRSEEKAPREVSQTEKARERDEKGRVEEPAVSNAVQPQVDCEPEATADNPSPSEPDGAEMMPVFYPMAQLHGTYILAQNEDGLYMIDQHAAQERINYEYFLKKLQEEKPESQRLLVPITVERPAGEAQIIRRHQSLFAEIGLEIEPFGPQAFVVRACPRWFPSGEEETIIDEMVQMVLDQKGTIDTVHLREEAAIMMSCKAAIKANRHLTMQEMEALLERLRRTTSPYTCPHGRPIIVHISTYEIEKMFKRVM